MADRSITLDIGARVTGFVNGMRTATTAANDFAARGLDKIERHSASIATVSRTAGIMGAAMTAAAGASVKAAIDWESSWADVQKVNDGTHEQMVRLEDDLREMARTLPATHEEIAATAEAAGRLGVHIDDVADFSRVMLDLGNTTTLSADEAATSIARFTEIMGTGTGDVDRLGSAITSLGNNFAATETEIVQMGLRIAGAGAQIGLTEAEVMGFATALSAVGIEAQAGGSAISRVMVDIATAVQNGGEELDAFAAASNMTAEEFAAAWEQDAAGAMVALVDGLSNAESQGQTTLGMLEDLGITNLRTRDAMLRLAGSGDVLANALEHGNTAFAENVALANEAEVRYETAASKIQIAWNNIKDAAIEFGAAALPLVADLADAVSNVAQKFGELPDWVQTASLAIVGGGGLVLLGIAGLGQLALAVSGVTTAIRDLGGAAVLGRAATSFGLWGAAVAGATTVIGYFISASQQAKRDAEEVRATLDEQTGAITANTEAWVAKKAQEEGLLDTAQQLGLNLQDVTQAMLGNEDAARRVQDAIDGVTRETNEFGVASYYAADGTRIYYNDLADLEEIVGNTSDAISEQTEEQQQLAEATGQGSDATQDAIPPQAALGDQMDDTTGSVRAQEDALHDLMDAQREAAGIALSERDAMRRLEQAFDDATDSVDEHGSTLDVTTEAGRRNQERLDGIASAAHTMEDAMRDADAATEDIADEMHRARGRFIDAATAMGMAEDDAKALATELGLLPRDVYIDVEANMNAEAQIQAFRERWAGKSIGTAWIEIAARDNLSRGMAASGARYTAAAQRHYGGYTGGPVMDPSHRKITYRALGGPVAGGDGSRDSVRAVGPNGEPYRLDDGEHIWTKQEVVAAGGHAAMYALRSAALSGALSGALGFQGGGSVGAYRYSPAPAPRVTVQAPSGGGATYVVEQHALPADDSERWARDALFAMRQHDRDSQYVRGGRR